MDINPPTSSPDGPAQSSGQSTLPPIPSSDQSKLWAIIGYILPILFFVPLLGADKDKPAVRFHANQQLTLLIYWLIVGSVLPLIPVIGWMLMPVAYIFGLALMVIGLINVSQGAQKPLPLLGAVQLIK